MVSGGSDTAPSNQSEGRGLLAASLLGVSGFVVANYARTTLWPAFLLYIPLTPEHSGKALDKSLHNTDAETQIQST